MPTLLYLAWWLEIVNQHTKFGYIETSGTDCMRHIKIQKDSIKFWTFTVTLTLKTTIIFTQNIPAYDEVQSH